MPFLTINGYTVKVTTATVRRKLTKVGRRQRAFRGQIRDARRGVRRMWDVEACFLDFDEADALVRLVNGEGHFVDFRDGLQASTGLVPLPGRAAVLQRPWVFGSHGLGVLTIPGTVGAVPALCYDAQLSDDEWTVLWRQLDGLGLWRGYAKRSDGVCYREGVRDDTLAEPGSATIVPRVTDGVLDLSNGTGTTLNVDDLVVLPYRAALPMLDAWSRVANAKFGPCPLLRVAGDIVTGETILCVGEVTGVDFIGKPTLLTGWGWANNAKVVKFSLLEVDPAYLKGSLGQGDTTPTPPGAPAWWYDAQDVDGNLNASLVQGSAVATWMDKGTRAQDATQVGAGFRPLFQQNAERPKLGFLSSVKFDGVDDRMATAAGTATANPQTIACLHRFATAGGATQYLHDGLAAGGRAGVFRSVLVPTANQGAAAAHPGASVVLGRWALSIITFNGVGSPWRFDGVDGTVSPGASAAVTGLRLGTSFASTDFLSGDLVEIVAWTDASFGSFDAVAAYFVEKYGALPA